MKLIRSRLALTCLLTLLTASAYSHASDSGAASAYAEFACTYYEIDQAQDHMETLEFTHEVRGCSGSSGGFCFIPIRKLVTPLGCRELAANFGEDMGLPSLEVTLWSYCDASSGAKQPVSQTASFAADSAFFHLIAEWEGRMSIVKCKRQ